MIKMNTMKRFLIASALLLVTVALSAQSPPPPNSGGGSGSQTPTQGGNTPVGGNGAPIGEGLLILLGLSAAYGGKKAYNLRKENLK